MPILLWILVGVFYIIYKAFESNPDEFKWVAKWFGIFIGLVSISILASIIVYQIFSQILNADVIGLLTAMTVALSIFFGVGWYIVKKDNERVRWHNAKILGTEESYVKENMPTEKLAAINKMCKTRLDNIMKELKSAGYNVSYKIWGIEWVDKGARCIPRQETIVDFIKKAMTHMPYLCIGTSKTDLPLLTKYII